MERILILNLKHTKTSVLYLDSLQAANLLDISYFILIEEVLKQDPHNRWDPEDGWRKYHEILYLGFKENMRNICLKATFQIMEN